MNVYDYFLDDSMLDDDGTLRLCLRMFHDLNLTKKFSIPDEVMTPPPQPLSVPRQLNSDGLPEKGIWFSVFVNKQRS